MSEILQGIYILTFILAIWGICAIKRSNHIKTKDGQYIEGNVVGITEVMGRPTRYIVELEYLVNNKIQKKRIITADNRIKEASSGGKLPLIYVEKRKRIYWAEDRAIEDNIKMILLAVCLIFAMILFVVNT